uniref:Uncharacterized protein n=1 Tax=Magallana gigas TaxID=29159 RepID=K1RR29_MAGGI
MAEGGKRNSSPVQHKMEGLGGKNALNCNFSDRPCPWEWKTNQGKWVSFPKSENDKIQNAFDKNRKGTVLVKIDEDFEYNLSKEQSSQHHSNDSGSFLNSYFANLKVFYCH